MPEFFDQERYPRLLKHANTNHGFATLIEVNETSDGFLVGWAEFETGEDEAFGHSVFLGRVEDFK